MGPEHNIDARRPRRQVDQGDARHPPEVFDRAQVLLGQLLKATYANTEAGQLGFGRLLRETWTVPPNAFSTGLYTVMTFLDVRPPEDVLPGIEAQISAGSPQRSVLTSQSLRASSRS